ncbi:DNA-binding Lrp family transcriptional regulator [Bradyrhizobium sp. USDA 3686]|uniref:winged helix-turn-helix domain-containing protein n=1 Tax=Bradyrhizobium canariense TaxID=255045 RepID=UPI00195B3206|nr:winged helix-turn-helix domain-containing protein [Bradyrhizobium canariense]MBM7488094.1 DNA-binding Lrp family transcriptional regulator [Bradyrhizobium canariense]
MIQATSLFAYQGIKSELPRRQRQVRDELALHADMTNGELAHALNIPINQITPRTNELRKSGIIEWSQTRPCG